MMCKKIFDVVFACLFLVLFCPVFLLVILAIKRDSAGPIFFVQRRIGLHDREFFMYKFRTMYLGTPEVATDKLSDPQKYVTKVGYFLRKYSIDELPQLVNIVLGHMSFVGPRPALYNQYSLRRMRNTLGICNIRPGLTGWAQINGRDEILLEDKVNFDKYYYDNQTFALDMKIILLTIHSVRDGNGVVKCVTGSTQKDN